MAISHLYPTQRPALDLNFARQKRLDSRVTYTRGSTATYVGSDGLIKTAASGEARFDHDPVTGESLGLLVEESRTNLLTYSQEFDNAAWGKANATVTPNAATAPDGTITADKFIATATNSSHYIFKVLAVSSGTTTCSIYAKSAELSWAAIVVYDGATYRKFSFNVSTGEQGIVASGLSSSIEPCANGWYRISCTYTSTGANNTIHFMLYDGESTENFLGDGTSGIYVWGAQLEAGSFPASYIPTSGSTVTRSADVASMTGTNFSSWYNVNEGTWFGFIPTISGGGRLVEVTGPGASDYSMSIRPSASSSRVGFARFNSSASNVSTTFPAKMAASYNSSSIQGAVGGTLATLLTTGSHSNSTVVNIGRMPTENSYLNGTIARLTYYPTRLSNDQLQALTL